MVKLKTKIGNQIIEVELQKMLDVHKFNSTYGSIPKKCDVCESENIFLSFKSPKGNDYYMVECGDCHATANFGQHKDGKGLYWKNERMSVYKANDENQTQQNAEKLTSNVADRADDTDEWKF